MVAQESEGEQDIFQTKEEEEDRLIQERRRRRLEILALHGSEPKEPDSLAHVKVPDALPKRSSPTPIREKKGSESPESDMFASVSPQKAHSSQPHESLPVIATKVPEGIDKPKDLVDDWDDSEGYYKVVLGEIIGDGKFHVHANIGKGVFSSVVRARDTLTGVDVAIKIIRNNPIMRKAGLKEAGILEKLRENDPHGKAYTVLYKGHFEHKNHLCLVFESLHMNLREVLKKFGKDIGLNIKAVRVYAHQLLLALSLLEKSKILHADIKPDNILVTEQMNTLRLCDFGSASSVSENEITPYLVSRYYRAPEIRMNYDHAIDMWSVAVSLYELYTGRVLFPGKTNNQMLKLMMQLKGKFPNKTLRRGKFTDLHFDTRFCFRDRVTLENGKIVEKIIQNIKVSKDIKSRLLTGTIESEEERLMITYFADFLDKALVLNPEKRLSVSDALLHPFIINK